MTAELYQIETTSPTDVFGKITRLSDNALIPVDVESAEFCEFLEWVAQREDGERFPTASRFFCRSTASELFSLLRSEGRMLAALGGALNYDPVIPCGEGQFVYRLHRTIPERPDYITHSIDGVIASPLDVWVSGPLLDKMDADLRIEESEVRCFSSWAVHRTFLYVDISDFSTHQSAQQALIINGLNTVSSNPKYWQSSFERRAFDALLDRLCIGDGYIFVFKDELLATYFAARLACIIEHHGAKRLLPIEFHFRMGIHAGPVYRFWDAGREKWNFVGEGINGGARVLQAIGREYDDLIFISDSVRQAIRMSELKPNTARNGLMKAMRPRGRKLDKHGIRWRLYELSHDLIEK